MGGHADVWLLEDDGGCCPDYIPMHPDSIEIYADADRAEIHLYYPDGSSDVVSYPATILIRNMHEFLHDIDQGKTARLQIVGRRKK